MEWSLGQCKNMRGGLSAKQTTMEKKERKLPAYKETGEGGCKIFSFSEKNKTKRERNASMFPDFIAGTERLLRVPSTLIYFSLHSDHILSRFDTLSRRKEAMGWASEAIRPKIAIRLLK